jgi:hypothetical protein
MGRGSLTRLSLRFRPHPPLLRLRLHDREGYATRRRACSSPHLPLPLGPPLRPRRLEPPPRQFICLHLQPQRTLLLKQLRVFPCHFPLLAPHLQTFSLDCGLTPTALLPLFTQLASLQELHFYRTSLTTFATAVALLPTPLKTLYLGGIMHSDLIAALALPCLEGLAKVSIITLTGLDSELVDYCAQRSIELVPGVW